MNEQQQIAREASLKIAEILRCQYAEETLQEFDHIILSAIKQATESASDAYGRGVTAGKLEALKYYASSRFHAYFNKWKEIVNG